MHQDRSAERQLQELSEHDCWNLVSSAVVGRMAWQGSGGITIVPVNFVLDGREVLVRTAAYSAMARECDDAAVAFEVDRHDPMARSGWSVLIRGRAHVEFRAHSDEPGVDVWPSGARPLHLRLDPTSVSGRRLRPSS
ncbi:pyridoxamine 5'-phosphate oxidase family protein [Nocardioides sp.]|jgi:nitroimidazol reductase NimA-like FMN-containing flavoprotein (pyridoxamine 5'-phosphate oxidase superfamily)|uniref:pyridoxamine 5'-phosphate oxidase family protein n=1 Tax=Nocardioides sp. TaxID=35761 RepID=UPI001D389806|nr:pyridoxamine 5'-phosphate oxidase family protein [Nocardioides sp.]MBU1801410.1 pyridoxamine 5'-phosphate oxidase family protein [Actinomycetota bacterium]